MRKTLFLVALAATLALLAGCAQAPSWTVNGISDVGLTGSDVNDIDGFSAEIEEDGDESEPSATDYKSFPGVPNECVAIYEPNAAFSSYSTEIRLNSFTGDSGSIGNTFVFLYGAEEDAESDFDSYGEGFTNNECLSADVAETVLGIGEGGRVDVEETDPHCATDCRMIQMHYVVESSDGADKIDRTTWFAFMQRGNAVVGLLLHSVMSADGVSSEWLTVDQAVALVNLQSAKFDSYSG